MLKNSEIRENKHEKWYVLILNFTFRPSCGCLTTYFTAAPSHLTSKYYNTSVLFMYMTSYEKAISANVNKVNLVERQCN